MPPNGQNGRNSAEPGGGIYFAVIPSARKTEILGTGIGDTKPGKAENQDIFKIKIKTYDYEYQTISRQSSDRA